MVRKPKIYVVAATLYVKCTSKEGARQIVAEILDKPDRVIKSTISVGGEAK